MNKTSRAPRKQNDRKTRRKNNAHKKTICVGQIYAEWCGYCKSLKPEWKKMVQMIKMNRGRSLKNVHFEIKNIGDTAENKKRGLTVDKMLAELNMHYFPNGEQTVAINGGFPTLFKICGKKLEYYQGERKAKAMYKWFTTDCVESNNSAEMAEPAPKIFGNLF